MVRLIKVVANSNLIPALAAAADEMQEIDASKFEKFNPWDAHKVMRKPEMRRVVGLSLHFLKNFINESNNNNKGDR